VFPLVLLRKKTKPIKRQILKKKKKGDHLHTSGQAPRLKFISRRRKRQPHSPCSPTSREKESSVQILSFSHQKNKKSKCNSVLKDRKRKNFAKTPIPNREESIGKRKGRKGLGSMGKNKRIRPLLLKKKGTISALQQCLERNLLKKGIVIPEPYHSRGEKREKTIQPIGSRVQIKRKNSRINPSHPSQNKGKKKSHAC